MRDASATGIREANIRAQTNYARLIDIYESVSSSNRVS